MDDLLISRPISFPRYFLVRPLQASVAGEPAPTPEKPPDSPEPKGGAERGPEPEERERAGSPAPTKGESSSSQSKEPTAKASDPPSNESAARGGCGVTSLLESPTPIILLLFSLLLRFNKIVIFYVNYNLMKTFISLTGISFFNL